MVNFGIVPCLIRLVCYILYSGLILIIIPDCIEAVVFYARIALCTHTGETEQKQSLKVVVVYCNLMLIVIIATLVKIKAAHIVSDRC